MKRPAAISALLVCVLAGQLCAQPGLDTPGRGQPGQGLIDPLDITGESFSGVSLPVMPVSGVIDLRANRTHVWEVRDARSAQPTRRLLLEGDVAITLGSQTFHAQRAAVWISPVQSGTGDGQSVPVDQVYVYFDHVGSASADASSSLVADRLSVDGVIAHAQPIALHTDLALQGRAGGRFVYEAQREFARFLREIATGHQVALEDVELPAEARQGMQGEAMPMGGSGAAAGKSRRYPLPPVPAGQVEDWAAYQPTLPDVGGEIFADQGVISFDPGQITIVAGQTNRSLMMTDGVKVLYQDTASNRRLEMSARRAVVFLTPGTIAQLASFKATDIEGIFLEGDVTVTDGDYTLRGSRVYYDVLHDRAMIVDAVMWTFDKKLNMPLYVRAEALRQESATEFAADKAIIANTRFAKPHISIGAGQLKVNRSVRRDGSVGNKVDAHDLTLRAGAVPVLWWPRWVGDPEHLPIRDLRIESSSRTGPAWKTRWDLGTLLGLEMPEGVSSDLIVDYYNERGFALGTDTSWDTGAMQGNVFAYMLFDDTGTDVTPSGSRLEVDGSTRSIILAENKWAVNSLWRLTTEAAYVSDERLVDALFPLLGHEHRELTTRARLDRTDDNSQLSLELKSNLNDFLATQTLLESRGYSVDKLPEVSYVRVADDLSGDLFKPGTVTLNSEYRLGQLVMNFSDPAVQDLGFAGRLLSQQAFGVDPTQSIADRLRAQGLREDGVYRLDTRHELSAVFNAGPVRVNPFLVGRFSAYDQDFSSFSPSEKDNARLWGAAGVRFATTIQRVDSSIESRFFDLHRMRHVIEPSLTLWHGASTVDRVNLPVFDDAVESLVEGSMVRVGLNQTWQTKRGGPGRWRTVDVLTLRGEYVWSSEDADSKGPIGRFVEDRPELSNPGEFFDAEVLYQMSDPIGITGRVIYDMRDTHQVEYSTAGVLIDHGRGFRSSFGERFVNALDSTVYFFNASYELTPKYTTGFALDYDTRQDDISLISGRLQRSYPNLTVGLSVNYNKITSETSLGFIISPRGLSGGFGLQSGSKNTRRSGLGG